MYRHHPQFHVLLEGMDTETADASDGTLPGGNNGSEIGRASSLLQGTFTTAALNALSISEDVLPPPEQLLAMLEASGRPDSLVGPVLASTLNPVCVRASKCDVVVLTAQSLVSQDPGSRAC